MGAVGRKLRDRREICLPKVNLIIFDIFIAKALRDEHEGLESYMFEVPIAISEDDEEIVNELYRKLRDVIIFQRLVNEEDLDRLFAQTKEANQIDSEAFENMILELKQDVLNVEE